MVTEAEITGWEESAGRKSVPGRGKAELTGCEVQEGDQCVWKRGRERKEMRSEGEAEAEQDSERFDGAQLALCAARGPG